MNNLAIAKRIKLQEVDDNFKPYPNIDYKYGPYSTIDSANRAIPKSERAVGLTVGIIQNHMITEYWYSGGIDDQYLVKKVTEQSNGGTVTEIVNKFPVKKVSNLTLTVDDLNRLYASDEAPILIDDTTNNKLVIKTDNNRYYILDAVLIGDTPPSNIKIVSANVISMK